MNFLEVERVLLQIGFERKYGNGSDIKAGVLSSIIRQSRLKKDLFILLLGFFI